MQSDEIKEVEEVAKLEDDQLILMQKMEVVEEVQKVEEVRCFVLIYNSNNLIIGETK
jgi:hypothetical protein